MPYSPCEPTPHEWLPEIPNHWEVVRFSFFVSFQEGPGIMAVDFRDEGVPLLRIRNVQGRFVDPEGSNFLDPEMVQDRWAKYACQPGDLLISCSASTGLVSEVTDSARDSIAYTGLIRLWPQRSEIIPEYIRWIVVSDQFLTQISILQTGAAMQHYGPEHLGKMRITLPPPNEQKQIADFLDWKTGQIDALIAKKKQLIEKLQEQRSAVITQAVTKGLNPDAPMRDSGIPWLDSVPEAWNLTKLRFMFEFGRGLGITKANLLDSGIPCINYGEIHSKYGFEVIPETHDLKFVSEDYLESGAKSLLSYGDFVFADTSEDVEGSGNFSYLNSETPTFAGYHTVTAKPLEEYNPRYLAYLFDSPAFRHQIRKNISGVKVFSITQGLLKSCSAWLPEMDEQTEIVDYLDLKCGKMDRITLCCQSAIEKLTEYRAAIITAATTGKIDVRKVKLPTSV
ncbi:restriction endonuclease subunit S [Verrucomicrobiaceae bacterium N1E253]|uniref:Restriction endonuclease subunit S n=1 Tax=Oceaniferula marina TaxID=2748318 RepID=A0A851GIF7_9BACT|nr:restriction endonuclease subunit S [Oceaniferula marina]NWK55661.1 restriction endonuclease subunit S [Oceaniferula marina]